MGRRADNIWADRKWMANQTWADIRKHVSKPLWPLPVPRAAPADPLFLLKQAVLPILLPLPSFCPPMESAAMARSPASLSPAPLLPVPARIAVRLRHAHALSFRAARPLVARCACAGDRVEAQTPIEKCFPAFPSVMDINQIRDILPHRYPFLLVDRVVDYKPGEYAVAIKNVSINDEFFQGHFPGRPIMPGVLMVEALAQVGGIVMLQPEVGGSREKFFFAGIDKVRFRKPVVPGDTLIMRMALIKLRSGIAKMRGKAYVGFDLVCEGEFLMATGSQ